MPGNAPALTDERQLLLAYLAQQRAAVRNAIYGLTEEQARLAPTASALSVGGLVKHVATVERTWLNMVLHRPNDGGRDEYMNSFGLDESETIDGVIAMYDAIAAETDTAMADIDLDREVPVPQGVPWHPADLKAWTVRWVLLHMIEETARHAGHADIIRESVDGATAMPLMAAVEGWPATAWVQPWQPATS
jgi:uncharacterized damage-inducible protein DinB